MTIISEIGRGKSLAGLTGTGSGMELENLSPVMMIGTIAPAMPVAESWGTGTSDSESWATVDELRAMASLIQNPTHLHKNRVQLLTRRVNHCGHTPPVW